MKLKNLVGLVVLFALSFSIVHEYAFAYFDENHCSAVEYAAEIQAPSHHGDICDIHFEYHQAFVLNDLKHLPLIQSTEAIFNEKQHYTFFTPLTFLKPPIV